MAELGNSALSASAPTTGPGKRAVSGACRAVLLGTIALATAAALLLDRPPPAKGETAPAGEFSAGRALAHLRIIAAAPRPIGSQGHARARAYLVEVLRTHGLEPSIQSASLRAAPRSGAAPADPVQNIVAVLPGRASGRGPALLIASHYDSVAAGPGASDDGAAVAAMLETLRALRSGPPLANDVIFLFTDAEEVDLDGAVAFAARHRLAGRVGAVLNFDARGTRGPVFMFETSRDNGWLIDQLAAAAPHITATSLAVEVYRRMPNSTDFTVFRMAGMSGMNFAYIGGVRHYHTAGDTIENLDPGSLQHHGSYMLSLARRLGNADLRRTRATDAVYFSLAGGLFVHYASTWVLPLLAAAGIVMLAAVAHGVRRGLIRWRRALASLCLLLAVILATGLLVSGAARAASALVRRFTGAETLAIHDSDAATIGFLSLATAFAVLLYARASRRFYPAELAAGALTGWLLLAAHTAFAMPGASYLFTWPLLFASAGLWSLLLARRPGAVGARQTAALAAAAVPSLLILAPTIHGMYVTATTTVLSASVLTLIALTVGLLAPQLAVALGPSAAGLPPARPLRHASPPRSG